MSELLDLDAIAARAHLAVAGAGYPLPWQPRAGSNDGRVRAANGAQIADCGGHEARAEFIAHAVEDVPALVAEVRRLRAKNDEWQQLQHVYTLREHEWGCEVRRLEAALAAAQARAGALEAVAAAARRQRALSVGLRHALAALPPREEDHGG